MGKRGGMQIFIAIFLLLLSGCSSLELGDEAELALNEAQDISGTDISMMVTNIINEPCTDYSVCGWSGVAAELVLTRPGEEKIIMLTKEGSEKNMWGIRISLVGVSNDHIVLKLSED